MRRHRVGVFPPAELASRARLFDALASTLPVDFVSAADRLDGAVHFDGARTNGVPCLSIRPARTVGPGTVAFVAAGALDTRLRARELADSAVDGADPAEDGEVLATCGRTPLWTTRGDVQSVSIAPPALAEGETLRDHLRPGRFMGLLPLLHFLRRVTVESAWAPPPLRACFLFDDPNLHRATYGYVRFAELAQDAAAHDYHAAMAMIPLDASYASRSAARIFRSAPDRLSLLVHGNDHVKRELGRLDDPRRAEAVAAQALRRVRRFEARTGLHVSRVMAPPHGACSTVAMHALARLGFDALCISDAYKGAARPVLSGFEPGELLPGGLPLVPRYHLGQPRSDLVFRGLLGQPVVLYGHHEDLAGGLEPLHEAADELRQLGDVTWMSTEQIAATQFASRQQGSSLHVRAYARRLRISVPADVERLHVQLAGTSERLDTSCSPGTEVLIELPVASPLGPDAVPAPARTVVPLARRVLTEGRDRLRPVLRS